MSREQRANAQERRPTRSRLRRTNLGWASPAPHDLAAQDVALEHLAGVLVDALAQVRSRQTWRAW
eukprot:7887500-Alexandrium_andersonii.AAC.1